MSKKTNRHPIDKFCTDLISQYPKSLEIAEMFKHDRKIFKGECPDWCALPTPLVASAIADKQDLKTILQLYAKTIVHEVTAALIWSRNKMIYSFDDTLADILATQRLDSKIPSEILDYLPYPCVYIERNMKVEGIETVGFFAWLDWGTLPNKKLLYLLFRRKDNKSISFPIPILGGTIADNILELINLKMFNINVRRKVEYTEDDVYKSPMGQTAIECLNLLLYLCSEKPDMHDETELRTRRSRDTHGNPKRAAVWEVGTRIGAALRKTKITKEDTKEEIETDNDVDDDTVDETVKNKLPHSSPRPHLRRAHWHSFWTGKRDSDERKIVLRWLPPIAVNIENDTELPTVINPVKE